MINSVVQSCPCHQLWHATMSTMFTPSQTYFNITQNIMVHQQMCTVYCVHYICLRYRSLLWDIALVALCATTIQCRTQKYGTTHSLVWEAPPLVWHNGLGTWAGLANVEITLKWKHSAAGKTIQHQRQPSWDLNWRRSADRSRLESWWENIHSTYRGIHRVGSYRSMVLPHLWQSGIIWVDGADRKYLHKWGWWVIAFGVILFQVQ